VRGGVASGAGLEPAKAGVRILRGTADAHPESMALGSAAAAHRLGYLHPGPVREVRLELTLSRF
jgi:hypothetical protein